MFETVLNTAFILMAVYLFLGALLLLPFHARVLPQIISACKNTGISFRILITPGLVTLWPVALLAWRRQHHALPAHGPVERPLRLITLQRGHRAFWFIALVPLLGFSAMVYGRYDGQLLRNNVSESTIIRYGRVAPHMDGGRLFPSLPANVRLVWRRAGYQLRFDFDDQLSVPATGLYWAPALSESEQLPTSAVLLGILEERQLQWFPLPTAETFQSGFWIVYSFVDDTMESFAVPPFPTE